MDAGAIRVQKPTDIFSLVEARPFNVLGVKPTRKDQLTTELALLKTERGFDMYMQIPMSGDFTIFQLSYVPGDASLEALLDVTPPRSESEPEGFAPGTGTQFGDSSPDPPTRKQPEAFHFGPGVSAF